MLIAIDESQSGQFEDTLENTQWRKVKQYTFLYRNALRRHMKMISREKPSICERKKGERGERGEGLKEW